MTVVFCDGFDVGKVGGLGKWNLAQGLSPTGSNARTGYNAVTVAGLQYDEHQVAAAEEHATFIIGFAFRTGTAVSGGGRSILAVLKSDAGATSHLALTINTNGSLSVYRGGDAFGVLLGTTAAGVITSTTYHYVEMKATLHDSAGTVTVRVDETTVLDLVGQDTKNGGTKTVFDSFRLYLTQVSGISDNADDLYVCNGAGSVNNDFLGAVKIETLFPNGNGNSSQWVGSDGNSTDNYALVDDPASGALIATGDYVEASTTGDKDTYAHDNSAQPTSHAVKAVVMHAHAYKGDAGAREIDHVARLSGSETNLASFKALLNATYRTTWAVSETKPGGGAWTVADVNSAEFGYAAS